MLMKYYPTEPVKFLRQEVNHQEQKSDNVYVFNYA